MTLLELETASDHIHVFVSAPPRFSPAQIANLLKGYSSRFLREKFPHLKKVCGTDQLWTQAYHVGTAGSVSAEVIRRYIAECQGTWEVALSGNRSAIPGGRAFIPPRKRGGNSRALL